MNRRQQTFLLIGLSGVMLAVYGRALWPRPAALAEAPAGAPPTAEADHAASTHAPALASPLETPAARVRQQQRAHAARLGWRRDPFTRGGAGGDVSGLTLVGILWDAHAPVAMINDQMLHVGDAVSGYTVLEIAQDRVTLSDGTDTFQLTITP